MAITLTLREAPEVPLEAPGVRPDRFAELGEREIAALPVWHGNERRELGDFFRVEGGRASDVRVRGETGTVKYLGAGMEGGRLVIDGDAGMHAGARMRDGELRITGDADDYVGAEMAGGVVFVGGSAGSHVAGAYPGTLRGMTGGELVVQGAAGDFLGLRMRRGVVAVGGDAGEYAGAEFIAGTIVVFGDLGRRPGLGLKRGSVVAHGEATPLPTYRYACTYRPPHLTLYLRALRERHGLRFDDRFITGAYRRYIGDFAELPKGEILVWTSE